MKVFLPLLSILAMTSPASAQDQLMLIGTYTPKTGESRGIYAVRLDPATGAFRAPQVAAETANPTFLVQHPKLPIVYSLGEQTVDGKPQGAPRAFRLNGEKLEPLNSESTGGETLCHLALDATARVLIVAAYGGGQVTSFPVLPDGKIGPRASVFKPSGQLGPNTKRQDKPHPHSVTISPDNRFAYVCDLGLDRVFCYAIDHASAALRPAGEFPTAPGAGPRHSKFSGDGKFFHVINELGSTITTFAANAVTGALTPMQSIRTLPEGDFPESITAEIRVHPNGRFVYGSNRGHDSIAVFARDERSGSLTLVEIVPSGGKHPRNFNLSPDGRWLVCANRDTDNIVSYRVDEKTGRLTATGHTASVPKAVCVHFVR